MRALAAILSVLILASGPALAAPPTPKGAASAKTVTTARGASPRAVSTRTLSTRTTGTRAVTSRATSTRAVSQSRVSSPRAGRTAAAPVRSLPKATPRPRVPPSKLVAKAPSKAASKRLRAKTTRVAARLKAPAPEVVPVVAVEEDGHLRLASGSALIVDQRENAIVYEKNSEARLPIASITKLMTAMVVLDARLPLAEEVEVTEDDVDWLKGSRSRLPLGTTLTRHELLYLALVSSDNRAASALGRSYPGGKDAFVEAMNRKARALGMTDSRFEDPTGLNPRNTSTAQDLVRMVQAAYDYPTIRQVTTTPQYTLALPREPGSLEFLNTNRLVRTQTWDIGLSKTGYINEAGRCLVMQADIAERPLLIVLLNGDGRYTPFADVVRLRDWLQRHHLSSTRTGSVSRTLG